jgi:formate-dependent phosphoribosylglycinamide formyltransferase (GAR transformylase)
MATLISQDLSETDLHARAIPTRPNRRMGVVPAHGSDVEEARGLAREAAAAVTIQFET